MSIKKTEIQEIAENLRAQDNRITDQPMFVVQQLIRDYGYDPAYATDYIMVDQENDENIIESDDDEWDSLHGEYGSPRDDEEWKPVYYQERWEFVTACFTEQGCKDYIKINGHNLEQTRIYAEGSYRNDEYQAVRNMLMKL